MCFSASASFGAGIVLSAVGFASIKKAQKSGEYFFAAIPLIFAMQQISEGFLWLALTGLNDQPLISITSHTFLFFAHVVWPLWVPLSIFLLEKNRIRKKMLGVLISLGGLVSVYLAFCLLSYNVQAEILGQHISYKLDYPPQLKLYGGFLYLLATIFPPFLSSHRGMKFLGLTILVSYLITDFFYEEYIISVWCFFASVISISVLLVMIKLKNVQIQLIN